MTTPSTTPPSIRPLPLLIIGGSVALSLSLSASGCTSAEFDDEVSTEDAFRFVDPDDYYDSDFDDFRRRLRLQTHIDDYEPLLRGTYYGTHNSYNTDDWSIDDNQDISIYRQLDLGMRYIELDRHRCGGINTVTHATCLDSPRPMRDALNEIRGWLDDNPDEFLVIMLEDQAGPDSTMVRDLRVIADLVYVPESCRGSDHKQLSKAELLAIGKRVLLYNANNYCSSQHMPHLEYAKLATHRFHGSDLDESDGIAAYPGCSYAGKSPKSSVGAADNLHTSLVRMREDATALNGDVGTYTNAEIERLVDCAVPIVNFDDVEDHDMAPGGRLRSLVWSWRAGEPNNYGDGEDCASLSNGGFNDLSCEYARRYACQHRDNLSDWKITGQAGAWLGGEDQCALEFGAGYQFAVPKNGYQMRKLVEKAGGVEVWLNYTDMLREGEWVAADNTTNRLRIHGATLWSPGEPNDYSRREDCAHLDGDGLLNDNNCGDNYRFLCVRRDPNGDEWRSSADSGIWIEGQAACEDLGENFEFSTPSTPAELATVNALIAGDSGAAERWVNLSDAVDEGVWLADVRVDISRLGDGSFLPYHWGTGEPNNAGDERCVELANSWTDARMNDVNCGAVRRYACKDINSGDWNVSDSAGVHSGGAAACSQLDQGDETYVFAAPSSYGDFLDIRLSNDPGGSVFVNLVRSTNQNGAWEWGPDLGLLPAGVVEDLRHVQVSSYSSTWGPQWFVGRMLRNDQGWCLDIEGGAAVQGADVEQDSCNGSTSQMWILGEDGEVLHPASNPDLCIDAEGNAREDGTPLILWSCNEWSGSPVTNQSWARWIDGLFLMSCTDEPFCALSIGWPAINSGSDAILETPTGGESEPEMRWHWHERRHY